MDLIRKYFEYPKGRKQWCVSGEYGSLSFWVEEHSDDWVKKWGEKYYGGVENHYNEKSKPSYIEQYSKHDDCICNGGVCYHDGTSLWASEHWIPYILPGGNERIWQHLEHHYSDRLKPQQDRTEGLDGKEL